MSAPALTTAEFARRYEARRAHVIEGARGGLTAQAIARSFRLHTSTVKSILRQAGIEPRTEMAARSTAARKALPAVYEVPSWVPADLVETFHSVAAEHGEERAVSVCRRLKREARP